MYFVMKKDDFHFCVSLNDILDVVSFLQESGILKQHPIEKAKNVREEAATALSNGKIEPKENNFPLYSFTGDIIEAEMAEDVLICLRVAELSGEIEPLVGFWNLRGIYPRLEEWFRDSEAEKLLMKRYWERKSYENIQTAQGIFGDSDFAHRITCEEAPGTLCPWRGKHALSNAYIIPYILLIYKFIYVTVKYVDL